MFAQLPEAELRGAGTPEAVWRSLLPVPLKAPSAPRAHPTLGDAEEVFTYCGAGGDLLGYVYRYTVPEGGKEFRPLTYCEHSGTKERRWRWKNHAPPRPLYGLDRLAARDDAPAIIAEGEKAADAAGRLLPGFVAVTSPGGSNGADGADWRALAGRRVVIWPDADGPGQDYAAAVARCLEAVAAEVVIIAPPPEARAGWDAADAEVEGWNEARILALVEAAGPAIEAVHAEHDVDQGIAAEIGKGKPAAATRSRRGNGKGKGADGPPQRDQLIGLIGDAELWHSPDRVGFASVRINGHVENWEIRSRDFRFWLAGRYFDERASAAGGQAMEDALRVLEAKAIHRGPCYPTWRRVGERDGAIYLDLCDQGWRAVEVTTEGWSVTDQAPVKFLRSPAMRPLPEPEAGEPIEALRGFLNVDPHSGSVEDADFKLCVAWLLAALRPQGPFPILIINGEQGSAKSLTMRLLRALVDPNLSPNRAEPRDERDLMIAAYNSWAITLDNISRVSPRLSDALCRLATGGGFATRELHTDRNEVVLDAQRPIILNGIPDLASRADLGDRAIVITLPTIAEHDRRVEQEFLSEFDRARPAILGALLDAVSVGLKNLPSTRLERLPRMADFGLWIAATASGLGWEQATFLQAYTDNRSTAVQIVVENNAVAQAIQRFMSKRGEWEGSASELLPLLEDEVTDSARRHKSWPTSASSLGGWLGRLAPALRAVGIDIRFARQGKDRRRVWTIWLAERS